MKKQKFTILGMTGSGKTCYLLSMYKQMLPGVESFTLNTDHDTHVDLRNRYKRMDNASLGSSRFPNPTNQPEIFHFTLEYALSSVMSFDWIDYPGGLLKEKGSGNSEQYAKLSSYVKDSGCLFICVDGELLQGYDDNEDKSGLIQDNCSSLINPFLAAYLHENKYLPPTVIIVTKWDLCAEYVSDDDLAEIMKDAFSPLFVKKNDGNLFVTIQPVSLGANITENNNCGRLVPKNIQIPIFIGIWFSLYELNFRLTDIIDFKERRIRFLEQKRSKEQKSFFLFRDDKKIASLTKNANNKKWEILKEKEQLEKAIKHSDLLLKQLQSKIKLAYYNGEEYESFSGAAIKYLERRQRQISSNPRLR
ncbi:MAG: hypothetical protein Q4F00_06210 [bacterium]|nr:hypothetical protein [bacterium]